MKKIILLLFTLFPVAVYAEVLPDVPVKSITRGADKVKYAGSVSAGVAVMFPYVNTSHGVIFPGCNIYVGGSAEYLYAGRSFINVAADGRWFYPANGKVQGYVGLEAGAASILPGVTFDSSEGVEEYSPGSADFFVRPGLGLVVNFQKVSLDIGVKCGFTPQVTYWKSGKEIWYPIPFFGVGLWF